MAYEVVVVGGGIGGLTTAALLASRGVSVCLLERESQVGGCVAPFEKFGYTFENGAGLYALWDQGEIHDRIFAELPVDPPKVRALDPACVVRLPDGSEIPVASDNNAFHEILSASFPECITAALEFYSDANRIGEALLRAITRVPELLTANSFQRLRAFWPSLRTAAEIRKRLNDTAAQHLERSSLRFRRFIDAQLQLFGQCSSEQCSYLYACAILALRQHRLFAIKGGAAALANMLVDAIRKSGGTIRLNASALRLTCDGDGRATGVILLSGEAVAASRAVVSNLTIWDTYGKLIGLNNTPAEMRKQLKRLRGWGAYLVYLGIDEASARNLPGEHIIALTNMQPDRAFDPTTDQLALAVAPAWDPRAPTGKRSAIVQTFTDVDQWFAFHEDEQQHEAQDQAMLEEVWRRLHSSIGELGNSIEIIETATPRTFYESTRRKLGMVGGIAHSSDDFLTHFPRHKTAIPNLFMVGDTTFPGPGVAAVTMSALIVANEISKP